MQRRERPASWEPRSEGGRGDDAYDDPADAEPQLRLGEWLRERGRARA